MILSAKNRSKSCFFRPKKLVEGVIANPVGGRSRDVSTSGNTPTDLYRAYADSPFTSWTVVTPNPILTHLGTDFEIDQVADPCVIEISSSRTELYYDADDNDTDVAAIKLATFAGSIGNLISGT